MGTLGCGGGGGSVAAFKRITPHNSQNVVTIESTLKDKNAAARLTKPREVVTQNTALIEKVAAADKLLEKIDITHATTTNSVTTRSSKQQQAATSSNVYMYVAG